MNSPILLLVFNRPKQTRETFNLIRSIKPSKLYISADGPRKQRVGEEEICLEVRNIVSNVDWKCDVKKLFQKENMGCGDAVYTAISWFFDNEEQGIIIEDDCLVDSTFFQFCDELLERYKDDSRVMSLSAVNYHQGNDLSDYSYSFSRYSLMWGWATWRRAWKLHDRSMPLWPYLRNTNWLLDIGNGSIPFKYEWQRILDISHAQKIDTWDYHWIFTCWLHGGLTIAPEVNMVNNIGIGVDAAHMTDSNDFRIKLAANSISFPLRHPPYLNRNYEADRLLDKEWFGITRKGYIYNYLFSIPLIPYIANVTRPLRRYIMKLLSSA